MSLSKDLKDFILSKKATELGFANLEDMNITSINNINIGFKVKTGIVFYIALDAKIIKNIEEYGADLPYGKHVVATNKKLDSIALQVEDYLHSKGYNAFAQTKEITNMDYVYNNECLNTIPHKTVATKAGLGWIGKCATFISKKYGSAIRLSSVLTDAPLEYGKPMTKSLCGKCSVCKDVCPGNAVVGINWNPNLKREEYYDYKKCMEACKRITKKNIGKEDTICGLCIANCPITKRYVKKALKEI